MANTSTRRCGRFSKRIGARRWSGPPRRRRRFTEGNRNGTTWQAEAGEAARLSLPSACTRAVDRIERRPSRACYDARVIRAATTTNAEYAEHILSICRLRVLRVLRSMWVVVAVVFSVGEAR